MVHHAAGHGASGDGEPGVGDTWPASHKKLVAPPRQSGRRATRTGPCVKTPSRRAPDDCVCRAAAGCPQAMPRLSARAPRGPRALAPTPVHRGRQVPRLGALRRAGVVAAMTVAGCTAGAVLLAVLQAGLRPQLRPGPLLRRDHRRAPQVPGVAAAWAAAGVRRRNRPPDAPDCAPIEAGWSKVKTRWRTKAARTLEALEQAIAEALRAITSQDAQGGVAHAGYGVVSNCIPL